MNEAIVGGPLDGGIAVWTEPHVCVPLEGSRYATYHLLPWDGCVFQFDGKYHFGKVVTADELKLVDEDSP